MTPPLNVRRYEPPDRNAVWTVHDRAFRESPMQFFPWYNRYLRNVPETFLDGEGAFLVGTLPADEVGRGEYDPPGERVVACGGFLSVDAEWVPTDDPTVELRSIRVDPAFQRRGYGRVLVRELERRARERGYDAVVVSTDEPLRAARALYRSLGYERLGEEPRRPTTDGSVRFWRPFATRERRP